MAQDTQAIPNFVSNPSHQDILNAIHKLRLEVVSNSIRLHVIDLKLDALITAHPGADFSSEDQAVRDAIEGVTDSEAEVTNAIQNLPQPGQPTTNT
jgi:hypothetical protein